VLLKNQNNLLPLDALKIKTIAICGPNADNEITQRSLRTDNPDVITLRRSLKNRFAGQGKYPLRERLRFF